jgi:putative acetyltransferase
MPLPASLPPAGREAVKIRHERPEDASAISLLVTAAFLDAPHSDGTEAAIVDGLRAASALTVSLVATDGATLLGHVAGSPITIGGAETGWYGLGPVAVAPYVQGRGIGSSLVRAALDRLRDLGAAGCVVLGDPAYYRRFGFQPDPTLTLDGVPPQYFQSLRLSGDAKGAVAYHPAFYPRKK